MHSKGHFGKAHDAMASLLRIVNTTATTHPLMILFWSTASFRDFPELFRLALGKPLSELINDKQLINGVRKLIDFRNGIGHGRSSVYHGFGEMYSGEEVYEVGNQYETALDDN